MMANFLQAQGNAQFTGFGQSNGFGGVTSSFGVDFEVDVPMEMDTDEDTDMTDIDSNASSTFFSTSTAFTSIPSTPLSMFAQAHCTWVPKSTASSFSQTIAQTPTPANNAFAPLPDYSEQMEGVIMSPPPAMAFGRQPIATFPPHMNGEHSSTMQAAATQQQQQQQQNQNQQHHHHHQQPAQAAQANVPASRPPHKNGLIPFNLQTTSNTQQMPSPAAAVPNTPTKNGVISFTLQPATTKQQPTPPPTPPTTAATGDQPQSGAAAIKTQPHKLSQPTPASEAAQPAASKPSAAQPRPPTQAALPKTAQTAETQAASQAAQPTGSQSGTGEPDQSQIESHNSETKAPSPASVFKQPDWVSTAKVVPRWEKIRTREEIENSAAIVFKPVQWSWTVKAPARFENIKTWAETKADMVERDLEAIIQRMPEVHVTDPKGRNWKYSTTYSMFIGHPTGLMHDRKPVDAISKDAANAYSRPFAVGADWSSSIAPYPVTPAQTSVQSQPIIQKPLAIPATNPRADSTAATSSNNVSSDKATKSVGCQSTDHGKAVAAPPKLDVAHIRSILAKTQPLVEQLKKSGSSAQPQTERLSQNDKPSADAAAYTAAPMPVTVSFFGKEFSLSAPPTTKVTPSQEKQYEVGSDDDPNVDTEFDYAKCFSRSAPPAAASASTSTPESPPPSPSAQLFAEAVATHKTLPSVEKYPEVAGPSTAGPPTATVASSSGHRKADNGLRYDEVYATKMMRRLVNKTVPRIVSQVMFPAPRFSKSGQEDEAKILLDEILAREIHEEALEYIVTEYERKDTLSQTTLDEAFRDWFEDYMLVDLRLIVPDRLDPDEAEALMAAVETACTRYVENHPPTNSLYSDVPDESDDDYDSEAGDC